MRSVREAGDWFKRGTDIVFLLILAVGFYFIVDRAFQINTGIKQLQISNDLATWHSVFEQWLAFDRLLIDNPDVRPYLYSRKDIANDDPNFTKIQSYAIYVADFIDHVENNYIDNKHFSDTTHTEELERYFFQIFANSPIVCRVLFANDQTFYIRTKHLAYHSCGVVEK